MSGMKVEGDALPMGPLLLSLGVPATDEFWGAVEVVAVTPFGFFPFPIGVVVPLTPPPCLLLLVNILLVYRS